MFRGKDGYRYPLIGESGPAGITSRRRSGTEPLALVEFDLPVCANAMTTENDVQAQLAMCCERWVRNTKLIFPIPFRARPQRRLRQEERIDSGSEREMREHMR